MHTARISSLLVLMALTASSAFAQEGEGGDDKKVIYKDRTEIDFEGVEVAGELVKPQGALLLNRKRADFNPLIKLRTDFDEEMEKSVDEVK